MTKQAQIIQEIEQMIAVGRFQPGQMLPTQKELMDQYGVAIGTVQQALGRLQSRGVVSSTRGRGTVVGDPQSLASAGILRPRVEMLQLDQRQDILVDETAMVIQQVLDEAGFDLLMRRRLPEDVAGLNRWAQQIRAAVVVGHLPAKPLRALQSQRKPVIVAGELYLQPLPAGVSQVTVSPANIIQLAMIYLTFLGHQRIVLLNGSGSIYYRAIGQAFAQATQDMGIASHCAEWAVCVPGEERKIIERWKAAGRTRASRPTAILVDGGRRACRLILELQRENIRVPQDVSVLAINGQETSQLAIPTLSRVDTLASRLGHRLAQVLLEVFQQSVVVREALPPGMVRGDTCMPCP